MIDLEFGLTARRLPKELTLQYHVGGVTDAMRKIILNFVYPQMHHCSFEDKSVTGISTFQVTDIEALAKRLCIENKVLIFSSKVIAWIARIYTSYLI